MSTAVRLCLFCRPISRIAALYLLLALAMLNCQDREREAKGHAITASKVVQKRTTPVKPLIHFGIISRYNPRIMLEAYQPLMDYLTENTSYCFELKLGKDYEDAVRYLCDGDVQIAWLGGVTYLQAKKLCHARPILRPLNKAGSSFYRSVIMVRNDSLIRDLNDLRGRSLAFGPVHSTSGNLIPRAYLAQAGIWLTQLSHFENLNHHDAVAKAVLSGHFDAGTVRDIIAEDYAEKGLRILYTSEPIPSVPVVVRSDCDSALVHSVKAALLDITSDNILRHQSMSKWSDEFRYGFIETTDADYDVVRQIIKSIPHRCSVSCHAE